MDALKYLQSAKEDSVVLVSMPSRPLFSPQPWQNMYYTLLPINGDPDVDWGPIGSFAAAILLTASREGWAADIVTCIKLPPCFRSSKQPKTELLKIQP